MEGLGIFVRKEWREAAVTNRLLIIVIIFGLFGLMSPIVAKLTPDLLTSLGNGIRISIPPPTITDVVDQFLKNVANNGIFVVILLTMGSVAREKERGTVAFILTKPLTRIAFLAAKFIGLATVVLAGLGVAALGTWFYTIPIFHRTLAPGFWWAVVLMALILLAYMSLTFCGSVIASSTIMAAGIGLASFVALAALGIIPALSPYLPGGLIVCARAVALGQTPPHFAQSFLAALGWIVMPLVLAWFAFQQQELTAATAE